MPETVWSALVAPLQERPGTSGLHLDADYAARGFISYAALYSQVCAVAQRFRQQGVGPGHRVILPFATSGECIAAFFALIGVGALPLSVKPPAAAGQAQDYAQFLSLLASRFDARAIVQVPGLERVPLALPRLALDTTLLAPADDFVPAAASPHHAAFVQFSSGTTSTPKGVPIGQGQLVRQLDMILAQDSRTAADRGASWLPLYHDMGLIGALLSPMRAGHTLYLSSPASFLMDPLQWLSLLSERQVGITALPNFGLAYLLKKLREPDAEWPAVQLERLRTIYLGSDLIDADVVEELARLLAPHGLAPQAFTPCYGMAEAVLMVSCKPRGAAMRTSLREGKRVVSVGPLLSAFEMQLRGENGQLQPPGQVGEICLRGGTLSESYFEDARPLVDGAGFYRTGDLGYVEAGELFITGRMGERVKVNGQNIDLPHLENALQRHPALRAGGVAVVQLDDGELAVLAEPARLSGAPQLQALATELSALLLSQTGVKVAAERVSLLRRGQIKRTSSGKLQRHLMRQALMNHELKLYQPVPTTR